MCTSKETQTHADKHFRLYTSFVPWRSCWFLVLKRPSNIADKHFNFTPIIMPLDGSVTGTYVRLWSETQPSQTVKAVTFLFLWIINSTFTNVWGKFVFWQTFHRKSTRSATLTSSVLFAPFFMLIWIQLYRKERGGIATLSHSFSATLSVVSRLARSRQTSTLWLMNRSGDMNLGDTRTNTLFSFWSSFLCRDWQIRPDVCDVWAKTAACSVWTKSLEYSQTSYRF